MDKCVRADAAIWEEGADENCQSARPSPLVGTASSSLRLNSKDPAHLCQEEFRIFLWISVDLSAADGKREPEVESDCTEQFPSGIRRDRRQRLALGLPEGSICHHPTTRNLFRSHQMARRSCLRPQSATCPRRLRRHPLLRPALAKTQSGADGTSFASLRLRLEWFSLCSWLSSLGRADLLIRT